MCRVRRSEGAKVTRSKDPSARRWADQSCGAREPRHAPSVLSVEKTTASSRRCVGASNWYSRILFWEGPMMRRAFIRLIGGLALAWPLASYAQQPNQPLKRVGIIASLGPCPLKPEIPFVVRLAQLGWVEGRNFVFDCVSVVGRIDQVPALARELVSRRPDVLMAGNSPVIMELKRETTTIPIVMLGAADPVGYGLVTNLARPEANVTGVAFWGSDMLPKRIELLSEVIPQLRRLAIVGGTRDAKFIKITEEGATAAAKRFGCSWQRFQAVLENDYDEIFARLATEHFDAAYITSSSSNFQYSARIVELAL